MGTGRWGQRDGDWEMGTGRWGLVISCKKGVAAYGKQQISKVASFRLCATMQSLLEIHMHTRKTASQPASQPDRQIDR